jgi:hypothetical protein
MYSIKVTDHEYLESLPGLVASSVGQAFENLQPVSMFVGRSLVNHGMHNRRLSAKDGKVYNSWMAGALDDLKTCPQVVGSAGPVDPELWVLRFDDAEARPIGVFANFTCHVNAHFGTRYSSDYPGVIAGRIAEALGTQITTVFTPGACANINPIRLDGDWLKTADWFASRAVSAVQSATPPCEPPVVRFARRELSVSRRNPRSNPPGAVERLNWGGRGGREDVFEAQLEHVAAMPPELTVPLNVMAIGPFAVASNPGELFVEHGLTIKRRSPFPHTVVAELTNDSIMYQPTREAFEQQGYETLVGPNRVSIEGIESIVETSIDMLNELRRETGRQHFKER